MKLKEYKKLYKEINSEIDVDRLSDKYSKETLSSILSHKLVRRAKKKHYKIKNKVKSLRKEWENGSSFLEISRDIKFSPVLTARMILEEKGMSKGNTWSLLKDPNKAKTKRLKKELKEVNERDYVYSPGASDIQEQRGEEGEENIAKWLKKNGHKFKREDEIEHESGKTPDFLLEKPIKIQGREIHWIESKANFGDYKQIERDYQKQFSEYRDHFGDGAAIYWYGHVEDLKMVENSKRVIFLKPEFFD